MVYGWLDQLFRESCPACYGPTESGFCAACAGTFVPVAKACVGCGLEQPVAFCPRQSGVWHVDQVVAPLRYGAPLDHYLHALKYRGARSLARALALLMVPVLRETSRLVDALVAVPLHRTRLVERGYNQAAELARTLGHELELPLLARGVVRPAQAPSQTGQGAAARWGSVASAFAVRRDLRGLRIAIVDDVVTTGATVNALAAQLRAAGAARCVAWAVARTPELATQARKM